MADTKGTINFRGKVFTLSGRSTLLGRRGVACKRLLPARISALNNLTLPLLCASSTSDESVVISLKLGAFYPTVTSGPNLRTSSLHHQYGPALCPGPEGR